MRTSFTIKTTKMFWQQRQNTVVRFERHEIDTSALVFGEGKA
jgi:hypothetical protein